MINDAFIEFDSQIHFLLNQCYTNRVFYEHIKELSKKGIDNKTDKEKEYLKLFSTHYSNIKRLDYVSKIIFLYGIFEQFIENCIKEYVVELVEIVDSFDDLEIKVQDDYYKLWRDLMGKLEWAKYEDLNESIMIKNLYHTKCKNSPNILYQCFLRNGGNYNHKKVMETINALVGRDSTKNLPQYDPLRRYLIQHNMDKLDENGKYKLLDDLVMYRNEIAHNGVPDSMLSDIEFREMVHYVLKYAKSLISLLSDELMYVRWKKLQDKSQILRPTNTWKRPFIASFEAPNIMLEQNELIIVRNNRMYPQYQYVSIDEIRIKLQDGNIKTVDYIAEDDNTIFSIKTNVYLSKSNEFLFEKFE